MRIEIAGTQITDAVVDILDDLQNMTDLTKEYLRTLDEISRTVILATSEDDDEGDDARTLSQLRAIQMIRRAIVTLSSPPDADDPKNDKPILSL